MIENSPVLLIAMPQLADPNFHRSVVLILNHSSDGAMGLILNTPLGEHTLGSFAETQESICHDNLARTVLYKGGPVDTQRGWLHHVNPIVEEKKEILPGLFLSGSMESLKTLLEDGKNPIKFCLGYAGWSPGQLEEEMKQGAWLDAKSSLAYILETDSELLWEKILRDMGIEPANLVSVGGVH